jgi:hypothetical protein
MAAAAPWVFYEPSAKTLFFDCPLCCLPLKPPVLQCRNAHAACSGCAASRSNKCASCGGVYEHIHWLDSYHLAAKVRCPNEAYGCLSWVPYCMPDDHQLVCAYKPCCCPEPGCIFSGSLPTLRDHLASQHADKDVLQSIWRIKRAKVHLASQHADKDADRRHLLLAVASTRLLDATRAGKLDGAARMDATTSGCHSQD